MTRDYEFAVDKIMADQSPKKADLAGSSMGGVLALKFAAAHPALIDRLAIPNAAARLGPGVEELAKAYLPLADTDRWLPVLWKLTEVTFGPFYRVVFKTLVILTSPVLLFYRPSTHDLKVSVEALLGLDLTGILKKIKAPALLVGGDRDALFSAEAFRETTDKLPNARLVLFKDGTHALFLEHKKAFFQTIADFLKN